MCLAWSGSAEFSGLLTHICMKCLLSILDKCQNPLSEDGQTIFME